MGWRGKTLGGSIGSFFGPWGALAGAAAGHFLVDRKKTRRAVNSPLRLLAVTAAALREVAEADGRYTLREDRVIRAVLDGIRGEIGAPLGPHELAYLIDDAARIDQGLLRLAALARDMPGLGHAALVWLWRVAVSEAGETSDGAARIARFAQQAGLSSGEARFCALPYSRTACADPSGVARRADCDTLGVPYDADPVQIKAAYRALSLTYHPDKHAGLDPAIRALTAAKFTEIKAAYDRLRGGSRAGLLVRLAGADRLVPYADGVTAACFGCGRSVRLHEESDPLTLRCDACQMLFAMEPERLAAMENSRGASPFS
jgi:DnaJ like chaperone protein